MKDVNFDLRLETVYAWKFVDLILAQGRNFDTRYPFDDQPLDPEPTGPKPLGKETP